MLCENALCLRTRTVLPSCTKEGVHTLEFISKMLDDIPFYGSLRWKNKETEEQLN